MKIVYEKRQHYASNFSHHIFGMVLKNVYDDDNNIASATIKLLNTTQLTLTDESKNKNVDIKYIDRHNNDIHVIIYFILNVCFLWIILLSENLLYSFVFIYVL